MKKILYSLLTLAAALTVASCQQELVGGSAYDDGSTVDATFAVNLGVQTKAFADGTTVDKLYAGIYEIGTSDSYTWVADNSASPIAISAGAATVTFNGKIKLGKSYKVVFWAQKEGAPYAIDWAKNVTTGPTVTATATGAANDESRDAFFGAYETGAVTGSIDLTGSPVTLKRPFAQVNVLVPMANFADATAAVTSSMTVAQAPTVLNLATKATSDPADWTFSSAAIGETAFGSYANTHKYVAMNYVLVDQTAADARYDVTFSVSAGSQSAADKQVKNTPLKPNGRTNIVGNIFAEDFDITVPIIIGNEPETEQVVTTVTVSVGPAVGDAKELTYDPAATTQAATVINVVINHPINTMDEAPTFSYNPTGVATAVWVIDDATEGTGHIEVTPLVADGITEITATFPAVTKAAYSPQTAKFYVKVGNGQNTPVADVKTLKSITVTAPTKVEYTEGETLDLKGMVVKATYSHSNGNEDTEETLTEGFTTTPVAGATLATTNDKVTVSYTEGEVTKTAEFAITVNAAVQPDFTTIAGLKALLNATEASFSGTLTSAVVSFVAGTNDAVIKDASGSILYHKNGHGLKQGQSISGDVTVKAMIYNSLYTEITDLTATVTGEETAVEPEVVTLAQLAGDFAKYEDAYVKVVGVTSQTTTTAKGSINVTQDAASFVVYTNVAIPVNAGDIFTAEGTVTKYGTTEQLKVWKTADLTVTQAAPTLSANPATKTVNATDTQVTWAITSNTAWTITASDGVTASPASGTGNADVTLTFTANTGTTAKTLTATAKATGCADVTITITQNGTGSTTVPIEIVAEASSICSSTSYDAYSNDDWIMTCGSSNGSFGSNSNNADTKMKLGDNYVVATPLDANITSSSTHYAALISKGKLDAGITSITLSGTIGTGMTVGVTVSTDGTTWTKLADFGSATSFTFSAQQSVYYAVIIKAANKSNARYTSFSATFSNE